MGVTLRRLATGASTNGRKSSSQTKKMGLAGMFRADYGFAFWDTADQYG